MGLDIKVGIIYYIALSFFYFTVLYFFIVVFWGFLLLLNVLSWTKPLSRDDICYIALIKGRQIDVSRSTVVLLKLRMVQV